VLLYILHWRGAFGVARFDNPGNLREAYTVKRATEQGFTSFLYMSVTSRGIIATVGVCWAQNVNDMKAIHFLLALGLTMSVTNCFAQISKEQAKERKALVKSSKSELNEKATKTARKEAKKLIKEGWKSAPGALPLEKQLDKSYIMQMEYDEDMFPKFIMAEAMSIGQNYDAAKMQALELAKQNLAGQIQTEVTALIENTVANKQLEPEDAASVVQSISAGKSLISQSIGRVIPVVELYRTTSNKNKEVLMRIAYNATMAKTAAKKVVKENLEKRGDDLHEKLDKLLGW
jgi:hypothetical protein